MAYTIDGTDINTFGITISELTGFENLPKRKPPTERSWANENGIEAFTDTADIIFESRDLFLKGNLIADTILDAKTNFLAFHNLLFSAGELDFVVGYLGRTFVVYTKDAALGNRLTDVGDKVVYVLTFKLREINPTNVTIV